MTRACILGCEGTSVGVGERDFLREADPWAIILFGRNIQNPEQVRRLTGDLREALGRNALIFVDQEGGRVQRLKPPHWRAAPPAATFGALYASDREAAIEAVRLNHRLMAAELYDVGIDATCAPVLDLPTAAADPVIGDRALSSDPEIVAVLGRAALEGLAAGGVCGVIKHIPGHGRATADSHVALPHVEAPLFTLDHTDFAPFRALADAALMAMTAHVAFAAVEKDQPATASRAVFTSVIRGAIGFDGLVMGDDLSMAALHGGLEARVRASLDAGCDVVMHGNGRLQGERETGSALRAELETVAAASAVLAGDALARAQKAQAARRVPEPFDPKAGLARLNALLAAGGEQA